jgi:hypothetical protein
MVWTRRTDSRSPPHFAFLRTLALALFVVFYKINSSACCMTSGERLGLGGQALDKGGFEGNLAAVFARRGLHRRPVLGFKGLLRRPSLLLGRSHLPPGCSAPRLSAGRLRNGRSQRILGQAGPVILSCDSPDGPGRAIPGLVFSIKIAEMTDVQRALFWPLVAFNLIIAARSTYTAGADTVEEPAKLRVYNELQHQILPKIISHHNLAKWTVNDSDLLEVMREEQEPQSHLRWGSGLSQWPITSQ